MKIDSKAMEVAILKAEMERMEKDLRELMLYSDPLVARIFKLYQEEVERKKQAWFDLRLKVAIVVACSIWLVVMWKVSRPFV